MSIEITDLELPSNSAFTWTPQIVEVANDPNASAQGGVIGGINDAITGLAGLFTNGVNIFKSVTGQYAAAKQIAEQSATPPPLPVPAPGSQLFTTDAVIKMGLVVAIGAGLLLLLRKR